VRPTFADLGIPFPLFETPADEASEYLGLCTCSLCRSPSVHCFHLDIGAELIIGCPSCGTCSALDASDRQVSRCRSCGQPVPFPRLDDDDVGCCYGCLLAGKAAYTQDTVLGMITWEHAQLGRTHGVPGLLKRDDFEVVPSTDGEGWTCVRVPTEILLELTRTPTYSTIQGERWQFCCRRPMIYVGSWSRDEFTHRAPAGDGKAFFTRIVQKPVEGLWEDCLHDVTGVYVFRCVDCHRLTAHWDIA
jgi:uncharacterized protein CbrC (UPF0167 family)